MKFTHRMKWRMIRLKYRLLAWKHAAERLENSVAVERILLDAAAGKRKPPSPEECRKLAMRLGVPNQLRSRITADTGTTELQE